MDVEHGEWWVVGGHYHDKIVSLSGQGKCTFDIEKSWHKKDFTQSNKRKSTSFIITSSVSYWDSSTRTSRIWTKNLEDNCETSNAERRALNTHTLSLLCCSRVEVKLEFDILNYYYIVNPLDTEVRSRKKTHFLANVSFLDPFSASTEVSMEMAKNEIFSYCLFCFLKWTLLVMVCLFYFYYFFNFRRWIKSTWILVIFSKGW